MSIEKKQNAIIEEFSIFDDWMDKYAYLVDLGNELTPLSPEEKTDDNLIDGCQSKLWIIVELKDGKMRFKADSDAIITKGIASLLIRALEGETPKDVLDAELSFIDKIGLHQHLSPTRSNGLLAMIKRIKAYAMAFNAKA
ncbi:MAG: SufE family protein [Bacteroidales bacterium]|jgi:cysteine desulfuration protein SufE|nr:SufE family protein [Bacteroidales bacterium]